MNKKMLRSLRHGSPIQKNPTYTTMTVIDENNTVNYSSDGMPGERSAGYHDGMTEEKSTANYGSVPEESSRMGLNCGSAGTMSGGAINRPDSSHGQFV